MLLERPDYKYLTCVILALSSLVTLGEEEDTSNNVFGGASQRTCERDSECSLTLACISNVCSDPCHAATATPCPMKGGICKVVPSVSICPIAY